MTYDTYVLVLCTIVYVLMTGVTVAVIAALTKMSLKLVRCGAEDKKIIKEYEKAQKKRKKSGAFDCMFSAFLCIIFTCVFGFSLYVNLAQNVYFDDIPTLKVVNTNSMAKKWEENEYLFENHLNDQFQALDVVFLYKLPDESALELYDIVVYEVDDVLVVHRIVGIEEPNESHPDERYFLLQGDAVERPDRFPVRYSQMRAIYRGERVPFLGSFIVFMQSPAGWLCMILMLAATIATPLIDKKLERARAARYALLCKNGQAVSENAENGAFAPPIYLYPVYYDPAKGLPVHNPQAAPCPQNNEKGGERK